LISSPDFMSALSSGRVIISFVLGLVVTAACTATAPTEMVQTSIAVIPEPLEITRTAGHYAGTVDDNIVLSGAGLEEMQLAERLLEVIDPNARRLPTGQTAPDGFIVLAVDADETALGEEGYRLEVTPERIMITSARPVGVFYGIQTLRQLVSTSAGQSSGRKWTAPCCVIEDSPRFPWRGQLLDVSRHFLPLEFVRANIDYLAELKLNVFHWHLTDDQGWRVEVDEYPELTTTGAWRVDRNDEPWWGRAEAKDGESATYGGFYSREEIREIVEYARMRGVTIVPEVDMPGHCRSAVASYPELSCDGANRAVATGGIMEENTLCPGKEGTFEFAAAVLGSVMDQFPSEYIHIGGDECNKHAWRECSDCAERMRVEGLANVEELQSYFIRRLETMINGRGRKMLGWDEILEGGLAPNAVVMSWRGTSGGISSAKAGHEVVMTPSNFCYLDLKQGNPETEPELGYSQLLLRTAYGYNPMPEGFTAEEAKLVLGVQGNLWGESIQRAEHAHYMLFPRLFAIAEVGWSAQEKRDWDGFMGRLQPALERLEERGIGYAPSLYQVSIQVDDDEGTRGVELSMTTEHGGLEIRYTLDGTAPSADSTAYTDPIQVDSTRQIQAASFRDGKQLGRVTIHHVDLHRAISMPVTLATPVSRKYEAGGAPGLTDGKRGSVLHTDGRWLGFNGTHMEATVDLGAAQPIEEVALGCLEVQNSWIFYPRSVEVFVSEDGVSFESAGEAAGFPAENRAGEHRKDFVVTLAGRTARYIRVRATSWIDCPDWHRGVGGKVWTFADELLVR
jgi:hexosaminidase